MKIEQDRTVFTPITITLETAEEAGDLWDIMEDQCRTTIPYPCKIPTKRQLAIEISNSLGEKVIPND